MEKECWAAIETNYQLLYTHIDVLEIVSYLKVNFWPESLV